MASPDGAPLVLVTGVTGHLGQYVMVQLLERGYSVRGTVRSKSRKTEFIEKLLNENPQFRARLELAEADLSDNGVWEGVIEGCEYVIHVASPTMDAAKSRKDGDEKFLRPARTGMRAILAAALKHGVKRLVYTGSNSVCFAGSYEGRDYDESDYGQMEGASPYERSKMAAEKELWDFNEVHSGEMDVCVMLCGFITGPCFSGYVFPAGELIGRMIGGGMPMIPKLSHPIVDVRDCAKAHILALESPNSPGNRYILNSDERFWYREMAQILRDEFSQYGYKIPKAEIGKFGFWVGTVFKPELKVLLNQVGMRANFKNEKIKAELGMTFDHDAKQSLIDTAYQTIKSGFVKDRTNGVAATKV